MRVCRSCLIVPIVLFCGMCAINAQTTGPEKTIVRTGPPPSASAILAEHSISGRQQVVKALAGADPMLRSVAARCLVEEKDPDAIYLIRNALQKEKDPMVIATFSSALYFLAGAEEEDRLEAFCQSDTTSRNTLIRAAQELSFRHKGGLCAQALVVAYWEASTSIERIEVLPGLQEIARYVPAQNRPQVLAFATEASRSADLGVRVEARQLSQYLADFDNSQSHVPVP